MKAKAGGRPPSFCSRGRTLVRASSPTRAGSVRCGRRSNVSRLALSWRQYLKDSALLIRMFCTAPRTVASVAPSSRSLADAVTSTMRIDKTTHVVELGVGTGAITQALVSKGLSPRQYTGVELETDLVATLRTKYPKLSFTSDSAQNLPYIVEQRGVIPSHVVASLPWSTMNAHEREVCLLKISECLRPDGHLMTYSYLSALFLFSTAHRTAMDLRKNFGRVYRSKIIWRNLPPAMVWTCSK